MRKEFPQTPIITHLHTNTIHIKEPKVKEIISSTNAFIVVTPKDNEKVSKGNLSQIGRNFSNSLSGPDTLTLQEKVYLYNSSNKKLENIK